jgi:hypothetical protein
VAPVIVGNVKYGLTVIFCNCPKCVPKLESLFRGYKICPVLKVSAGDCQTLSFVTFFYN